ncbi:MAG: type I CRISPR-associated protein Cas7, partial [Candidatus Methylumidiphilus sp.]
MTTLQHKIDFAILFSVKNANPNGDPLNGNRPRTDYSGFGEITDVCLKRKIRDRLVERYQNLAEDKRNGQAIFVQSDDRKIDDCKSLKARAEATLGNKLGSSDTVKLACENWIDVRAFGQLFALKSNKKAG